MSKITPSDVQALQDWLNAVGADRMTLKTDGHTYAIGDTQGKRNLVLRADGTWAIKVRR